MVSTGAFAQSAGDQTVNELRDQVTRQQDEITRLKQELERFRGAVPGTPAPVASPAPTVPAAAAVAAPSAAPDPTSLETVVVRGKPKLEKLQDVPVSVSVVTGAELERLNATDIAEVLQRGGNVSWNQGNQRTSSLSIRGIGKVGQLEAMDPSVGVTIDGVPLAFNPLTSSYSFFDIDTVDVLRGPQGTLGGKNTGLGVINVNTRRPTFTPNTEWGVTFGEYDRLQARAAVGGAVVDDLLAYRASAIVERGNGWLNNNYVDRSDRGYNNVDRATGRVQFLLTPSQDFSARLILEKTPNAGEFTNTTSYRVQPRPRLDGNYPNTDGVWRRDFFSPDAASLAKNLKAYWTRDDITINDGYGLFTGSNGVTAELNWNLLNGHTLTSITGYRDYHFNAQNDDGTPFQVSDTGGVYDNYNQWSTELKLTSPTGGFVDYVAGLYLLRTSTHYSSYSNGLAESGAFAASNAQYNLLYHGQITANTQAAVDALYGTAIDGPGSALLRDSRNGVLRRVSNDIQNDSQALFANARWNLKDDLILTTGARVTFTHRINPSKIELLDNGTGALLNPVAANGNNIQLGGFDVNATTGAFVGGDVARADAVAQKYFGTATYADLTALQKRQVGAAQALRKNLIGVLYNTYDPKAFDRVQPNFIVSPSWKINDNVITYVSWQYGEKAGVSQVLNGSDGKPISGTTKAEQSHAYEWGVKTSLLGGNLILNADIFLTNIKNYLQAVNALDPVTPYNLNGDPNYISYTGNVPKVQAKGLEWDIVFRGIENLELTFNGAYNDARYKEFTQSSWPAEWTGSETPTDYQDVSGKTLTGAPKWSWNLGGSYRRPIWNGKVFHFDWNTSYTGKFNANLNLSRDSVVPAKYKTDLSVGIGTLNRSFDVSLLVKNAFNDRTPTTLSNGSITLPWPRWIGLQFTGKL